MLDQIPNQNQNVATPPANTAAPQPVAPRPQAAPTQAPSPQNVRPMPAAPQHTQHGSPKKGIIVALVIFLLLLGGSALAYFKEWYLMLPFFEEKKEEKVEDFAKLIFDNWTNLQGADFELDMMFASKYLDDPSDADTSSEGVEGFPTLGIPEDMEVSMHMSGSSFVGDPATTSDDAMQISISGSDKSEEMKFGADLRYVSGDLFYRINDNPLAGFFDITKGHMKEWIKISLDDQIDSYLTINKDDSEKNLELQNRLLDEAKKRKLFDFVDTKTNVNVKGVEAKLVDVSIDVREWMDYYEVVVQDIGKEIIKEDKLEEVDVLEEGMTTEEKEKVITEMEKVMKDVKISLAIDMATANLMMLDIKYSSTSTSYDDRKQENSMSITYKIFNHNNPTKAEVPDKYIDQDDIERESMGMDKDQYDDYKQAKRVNELRLALANHYYENRSYPKDLAGLGVSIEDINTGKDYKYTVDKNNYSLSYEMNTNLASLVEAEEIDDGPSYDDWGMEAIGEVHLNTSTLGDWSFDSPWGNIDDVDPIYYLEEVLEKDIFNNNSIWVKGKNEADRFSPIADQLKSSSDFLKDNAKNNYSDADVLQAVYQSQIIKTAKNKLSEYYNENKKYPESILDLEEENEFRFYFHDFDGFLCEDLNTGAYCDYTTTDGGSDYEIKLSFPVGQSKMNVNLLYSYKHEAGFVEGENVFTSQVVVDSDRDGLNDRDEEKYGTDPYNSDTDGDGYSDGEEVANGYDPLTKAGGDSEDFVDTSSDWFRGDITAAITIIEYSDYDCPYCKKFHSTMKEVLEEYDGQVAWIYRHFPLSFHPDAFAKSQAAECVGELGGNEAFWLFSDKLYEDTPSLEELAGIVKNLGYDEGSWQVCMDSGKFDDKINQQIVMASTDGATGTPSSIIMSDGNKTLIVGAQSFEMLKTQIDSLLK